MKGHAYLQEEEMIHQAVDTLLDSLGPVETARFLTLPRKRRLDSVTRHRQWQETLDRERFFEEAFGTAGEGRSSSSDA